jgi:hypothetical protein
MNSFDKTKYRLGKLCSGNHEFKNTGKTLRTITNGGCPICKKEYDKIYHQNNKEGHNKMTMEYYFKNKEIISAQKKEYAHKNKDHLKKKRKEYVLKNREKINKQRREYFKKRRKKDPKFRITHNVGKSIWESLKGNKMNQRWEDLVGYKREDLMKHLESLFDNGMNWDNYGKGGWEIDHIIPISVFNFDSYCHVDFKRCWALDNLQPLWAIDNVKKSNRLEKDFQPQLKL